MILLEIWLLNLSLNIILGSLQTLRFLRPKTEISWSSIKHRATLCWILLPNSFKNSPSLGSFKRLMKENKTFLKAISFETASSSKYNLTLIRSMDLKEGGKLKPFWCPWTIIVMYWKTVLWIVIEVHSVKRELPKSSIVYLHVHWRSIEENILNH